MTNRGRGRGTTALLLFGAVDVTGRPQTRRGVRLVPVVYGLLTVEPPPYLIPNRSRRRGSFDQSFSTRTNSSTKTFTPNISSRS